ncbi:N-formylglutamate amidohydrolase [Cereibacter changlensis JA139]|uniref:N-formylglutamate amidohydrolase n=2 Tax=Cereibacter changlensis TaxID=402884 RepID=A0A2T4K0L6_9RHOB|nr:N-formylglutamate amidohydrolase [Cereibacter changlensis]PTE23688.1 N-formylglutamate amidohydrolase [Cereibacter changlensis JA139]PZX59108.1 N-formylglutamate amidohydrolase [Cereibacter changlensis]
MTFEAYSLFRPERRDTAAFFSSPHSGRDYPASLMRRTALDEMTIRSSEDAFVDELFSCAPGLGAPLIAAKVPRAYIDMNRSADELDPALIEGLARAPHNPRVSSGLGVIPRVVANGRPIYRGKLALEEAETRIARYWTPYHLALRGLLEESLAQFGEAILIDCHSMPHEAIEAHARPGQPRPEVVLGDRFGAAAGRGVMERIEAAFSNAGLRVVRNAPFAGAYIAQAYGRPSRGQHVVQVEIDRALYMTEARIERHGGFDAFKALIASVVAEIADIGRAQLPLAAE